MFRALVHLKIIVLPCFLINLHTSLMLFIIIKQNIHFLTADIQPIRLYVALCSRSSIGSVCSNSALRCVIYFSIPKQLLCLMNAALSSITMMQIMSICCNIYIITQLAISSSHIECRSSYMIMT